jgi:hypothetical protein
LRSWQRLPCLPIVSSLFDCIQSPTATNRGWLFG